MLKHLDISEFKTKYATLEDIDIISVSLDYLNKISKYEENKYQRLKKENLENTNILEEEKIRKLYKDQQEFTIKLLNLKVLFTDLLLKSKLNYINKNSQLPTATSKLQKYLYGIYKIIKLLLSYPVEKIVIGMYMGSGASYDYAKDSWRKIQYFVFFYLLCLIISNNYYLVVDMQNVVITSVVDMLQYMSNFMPHIFKGIKFAKLFSELIKYIADNMWYLIKSAPSTTAVVFTKLYSLTDSSTYTDISLKYILSLLWEALKSVFSFNEGARIDNGNVPTVPTLLPNLPVSVDMIDSLKYILNESQAIYNSVNDVHLTNI